MLFICVPCLQSVRGMRYLPWSTLQSTLCMYSCGLRSVPMLAWLTTSWIVVMHWVHCLMLLMMQSSALAAG